MDDRCRQCQRFMPGAALSDRGLLCDECRRMRRGAVGCVDLGELLADYTDESERPRQHGQWGIVP